MKLLGVVVAVFAAASIVVGAVSHNAVLYLLAGFSFAAAFTTYRSAGLSTFLQILIKLFSIETVVLGLCVFVSALGLWPKALAAVRIPSTVVMTVAMFSVICHLTSFIPVARKTLAITDRYFRASSSVSIPVGRGRIAMRESTLAGGAIMGLIVLNQLEVWFSVLLTYASRDIFNAMQEYNQPKFWHALLVEYPLYLVPYLVALFVEFLGANTLFIRWRRWLTQDYTRRWLDHHNHYGMMLAGVGTDNPDQRIQEDIPRFIDGGQFGGLGVYNFSINLIAQLSSLVSFSIILWGLSAGLTLPFTSIVIPGFLLWFAIAYAIVGTLLTALIGRPLAALAFARQHFEANYRFALARLREYSEQIALLLGEKTEQSILSERFTSIVRNFYSIMFVKAFLTTFIQFFGSISGFIPYIVLGPFYFARTKTLGDLSQAAQAFGQVNSSLTFFVNYYSNLADFKSVLDRLSTFDASLEAVAVPTALDGPAPIENGGFALANLKLDLPNGRALSDRLNLRFAANENVLLTGPSGIGKSTLFRAISGVWPYREGSVEFPKGASIMLLPQKPYLPIGPLSAAVSYPSKDGFYDAASIATALEDVGLGHLAGLMGIDDNWSQRLSGGEQQRLALARATLAKPDWLLLDEATAALDVDLERRIYEMLARRLPNTTIMSIAHRTTLAEYHGRELAAELDEHGVFKLADVRVAAE